MSEKDAKRYKLICLLATGCGNKEAAEQMGTSISTIERLRGGIDFKNELSEAINQIYRNNLLTLSLGMSKASSELIRIIESDDTSDRVKLRAIEILFAQTKNLDLLALEDRFNRMEEQVINSRIIEQPAEDDHHPHRLSDSDLFM